jgi:2-polyprenyl-3-methyl-5-hydroxy-6-metoxy-1,4-benzoquinol methylase
MKASCPICRTDTHLLFRAKDYNRKLSSDIFHYYRCRSCDLIFLSPIPDDLGKYYPNNYYPIPASIDDLAKAADSERYKIEIVRQFVSEGKLLEIGPAYGSFLYLAKQAGFEVDAIEMDSNCCKFISETIGANAIQNDDPSEALKITGSYNVIALWHVIEHLPDPWKTLQMLSINLQPGGILILAAPNPNAFQFRVLGRFWPHVDAPRHLSLIPLSLLAKRMMAFGMIPIWSTTKDQGTLGWNAFGWVRFFNNLTDLRYVKTGLDIAGKLMSIILGPLERMDGLGSAYTVVFRKEQR